MKYFFKKLLLIAAISNAEAVHLRASASSGVATSAVQSLSSLLVPVALAAATVAVNLLSPRHQKVGASNDRPPAAVVGEADSKITGSNFEQGPSADVDWLNFDSENAGSRSDASLGGLVNHDQDDEAWLNKFFDFSHFDDALRGSKSSGLDDEFSLRDLLQQDPAVVDLPIFVEPPRVEISSDLDEKVLSNAVSTSSTASDSPAESSSSLHENAKRNAESAAVEAAGLSVEAVQVKANFGRGNKNLTPWQKDLFHTIAFGSAKQIQEILNKRPDDDTFELAFLNRKCFSPLKVACRRGMAHVEVLLYSGLRLHEHDTSRLFQDLGDKISGINDPYGRKRNQRYKNIMNLLKKDARFICTENSADATTNNVGNGVIDSNVWKLKTWQKNLFRSITLDQEGDLQKYLKQRPVHDTAELAFFNYNNFSPLKAACSYSVNSVKILLSSGLKLAEDDTSSLFVYLNGKIETAKSPSGANRYRKIQKLLQEDGRFTCADEWTAADLSSSSHDNSKRNALPASAAAQVASHRAARAHLGFGRRVKNSIFKGLTIWQQKLFSMIRYGTTQNVKVCLQQRPDHDTAGLDFVNNKNFSPLRTACSYNASIVQLLLLSRLTLPEEDTCGLFAYLNGKIEKSKDSRVIDRYRTIQKWLQKDIRFTCTDELTAADSGGSAAAIVPKHPAKRSATAASSSAARPVAFVQKAKRPKPKATKANSGSASGTNSDSEDDGEL